MLSRLNLHMTFLGNA